MEIILEMPDGHLFTCYRCDSCDEVIEDRPVKVNGQDLCPRCFGIWWSRTSPIQKAEPLPPIKFEVIERSE